MFQWLQTLFLSLLAGKLNSINKTRLTIFPTVDLNKFVLLLFFNNTSNKSIFETSRVERSRGGFDTKEWKSPNGRKLPTHRDT